MADNVNMHTAEDQLDLAGYKGKAPERQRIRNGVLCLINQINSETYSREELVTVLDLFHKLAKGDTIVDSGVKEEGVRWRPFHLGYVTPGTVVRVRIDAYDGEQGRKHNGMVGRLVAARGGQAIVQYAESSEGMGHRHHPWALEAMGPMM